MCRCWPAVAQTRLGFDQDEGDSGDVGLERAEIRRDGNFEPRILKRFLSAEIRHALQAFPLPDPPLPDFNVDWRALEEDDFEHAWRQGQN